MGNILANHATEDGPSRMMPVLVQVALKVLSTAHILVRITNTNANHAKLDSISLRTKQLVDRTADIAWTITNVKTENEMTQLFAQPRVMMLVGHTDTKKTTRYSTSEGAPVKESVVLKITCPKHARQLLERGFV